MRCRIMLCSCDTRQECTGYRNRAPSVNHDVDRIDRLDSTVLYVEDFSFVASAGGLRLTDIQNRYANHRAMYFTMLGTASDIQLDIDEWKKLRCAASRAPVLKVIDAQIGTLERQLQTSIAHEQKEDLTVPVLPLTEVSFYDDDTRIKLYLPVKSASEPITLDNVVACFDRKSLSVRIKISPVREFKISQLFDAINVAKCTVHIKGGNTVVITLQKEVPKPWKHFRAVEEPPKTKFSKERTGKQTDPATGLLDVLKDIYTQGDDDIKREIAKAWTMSSEASGERPPSELM